jgi:hypothetical protein
VCSLEQAALSYLLRSVRRLPTGSAPVRFQSGNSRDFAVNAGYWRHPLARQKRPICRDIPRCAQSRALLAMQKVVGSNPISRFAKGLQNEVFPRPPSSPELLSPDDCLRIGRAPAGTPDLKLGDLQANSAPVEPSSFCGPRRRPLVLTALVASQSRGISSCPSGPGRALAGAMATPVVLSRHVQTLAFIGFRHTARRWSGLPVIVPERAPGRDGGGARIRGRACAVSCKGILSGPV